MATLSVCMIVKNEEKVLARCLQSVQGLADEIVIVDTGSTDATKDIARSFTSQVYDFEWVDDFAAARNFSFSKATKDYIMWLDADDVLLDDDREAFEQLMRTLPENTDVVMCRYHTGFDERGKPNFFYYRERIVRNEAGFFWKGAIHEAIEIRGQILYSIAAVTHQKSGPGDPDRNLRIFEHMLQKGERLAPREQFYYARELHDHGRTREAIQILQSFLKEGAGWVENNIEACRLLSACRVETGEKGALQALLNSFQYDVPRAETCCDIGRLFLEQGRYREAIFWYELALTREKHPESGAFVMDDCYDYIPALQLCVCYDRMGQREKAVYYNELAGQKRPESPAYLYNKSYFARGTEIDKMDGSR